MHRKTCNRTEENHNLADVGSLSPIQNVTAAMLLEAPNEVKKKTRAWSLEQIHMALLLRKHWYRNEQKHQTTLRARKQVSLCFAQHWMHVSHLEICGAL